MKKLFDLGIGFDEETGNYCAIVNSLTDKKTVTVADPNIRVVMSKLSRRIRHKAKEIKFFPIRKRPPLLLNGRNNGVMELVAPERN